MKFFISLLCVFLIIDTNISFAAAISKPVIYNPGLTRATGNIKASEFIKLSATDISVITGKKMNLWNRLSFSFLKSKINHDLKKNPNLTIADYYSKKGKRHLGAVWIVLLCIAGLAVIFFIFLLAAFANIQ